MSEKEKKIMENFKTALPKMTELEKEKLLSFGEGMAFMAEQRAEADAKAASRKE